MREVDNNIKHRKNQCSLFIINCSLFIVLFFLFPAPSSLALDFLFRPKAFVYIPSGEGNYSPNGNRRYDMGGGADIGFEFDFSSLWPNRIGLGFSAGAEGGMTSTTLFSDATKSVINYSAGGVAGIGAFPLSRLFVRADGGAGIYVPTMDGYNGPTSLYWRGGGEIGFRFTPSFLMSANAGWRQYEDARKGYNPVSTGYYGGITAQFSFKSGGSLFEGAEASLVQDDSVYPAFMQLYQTNPVGTLRIKNRENAEIRNVRVSFRASPYTASEFPCGEISVIQRGRTAEIPLLTDFSSEVLRFVDSGRVLGEVVMRYRFLGQERTAISVISIACHNRNTITLEDITSLAVFVSPTSPEVLDFSKFIVGLARSKGRTGHNQNFQYAIWLYEGLRSYGVRLGETYSGDNEIQFPAETMAFRTGTSRDLAMLYATTLESVGISSAVIRIGTDYIVAINLSISKAASETLFLLDNRTIEINDQIWVPVAMSSFNEGFMQSWTRAAVSLNEAFEQEMEAEFVIMSEAWAFYPPAPLPALGTRLARTDSNLIITATDRVFTDYIRQDITPLIWRMQTQTNAAPTAANYNRLGILLVRAGRIAEAKSNYERAANMGSVPAMTNRGNLALNERDYTTAERWFRQALRADPQNQAALLGLEKVEGRK